jgi:hypothetical protein
MIGIIANPKTSGKRVMIVSRVMGGLVRRDPGLGSEAGQEIDGGSLQRINHRTNRLMR